MKKFYLLAVSALLLTGCGVSNPLPYSIDYFAFRSSEEGRWGMMNLKGEVLFEKEFKSAPTISVNDRFAVKNKKDYMEFYEAEKQPEQIGEGVGYKEAGLFTGKYAPVLKKDNRVIYIDKKGGVAIDLSKKYPGKRIVEASSFFIDRAIVKMDGKYGVIDTDGKLVVPCKYDRADSFVKDVAVFVDREEGKWYIIDKDGKTMLVKTLDSMEPQTGLVNGLMLVTMEGKEAIIDEKGEVKLKLGDRRLCSYPIIDDRFVFELDDSYGLMDISGKVLINPKYDRLKFNGAIIVGCIDDEWYLLDDDGKKIGDQLDGIPMLFDCIYEGFDSYFFLMGKDGYTLMNSDGEEVIVDVEIKDVKAWGEYSIYNFYSDDDSFGTDSFD